jgi:hypothetical protein
VLALARGPGKSCGNYPGGRGGNPSASSVLDFAPGFTRFRSSLSRAQTGGPFCRASRFPLAQSCWKEYVRLNFRFVFTFALATEEKL